MHYRVHKSLVVASELAAKPPSRASAYLRAFLQKQRSIRHALDYGCGKLRYAASLAKVADSLTLVDSVFQLDRPQIIDGEKTTVRQLACRNWPNSRLETVDEFEFRMTPKFDFILCANVLSAIPTKAARSRALSRIRQRLKRNGVLLVANQHSNSYFSQTQRRTDIIKHLDGWIVPGDKIASYYGVLNKEKVCEILKTAGFRIAEHWIHGQSNYAIAMIS